MELSILSEYMYYFVSVRYIEEYQSLLIYYLLFNKLCHFQVTFIYKEPKVQNTKNRFPLIIVINKNLICLQHIDKSYRNEVNYD